MKGAVFLALLVWVAAAVLAVRSFTQKSESSIILPEASPTPIQLMPSVVHQITIPLKVTEPTSTPCTHYATNHGKHETQAQRSLRGR